MSDRRNYPQRHSYHGTAVWTFGNIRHRFGSRQTEWLLAVITLGLGVILLQPGETFALPHYAGFQRIFGSEWFLGWLLTGLGIVRLIGLLINGAMPRTTPWIRSVSASAGFLLFCGLTYAHTLSGVLAIWAIIYPAFAVAEIVNTYRAAHDAGERHGNGA